MRRSTGVLIALAIAAALGLITALSLVAPARVASAQATYGDIEKTPGLVPAFLDLLPAVGIAGVWAGRPQ